MKKILLVLYILVISTSLFSMEDKNEKRMEPGDHWKESVKHWNDEIKEIEMWKEEGGSAMLLDKQIDIINKQIKIVTDFLDSKGKNFREIEGQVQLLNMELGIIRFEIEKDENLNSIEEGEESSEDLAEIYDEIIKIEKQVYELKKEQFEIQKKLSGQRDKKRLEELQKEMDKIKEDM